MDYGTRCTAWAQSLTVRQLGEARATRGSLPKWVVGSLRAAGIDPVGFEHVVGGVVVQGWLMPTGARDAIESTARLTESSDA